MLKGYDGTRQPADYEGIDTPLKQKSDCFSIKKWQKKSNHLAFDWLVQTLISVRADTN